MRRNALQFGLFVLPSQSSFSYCRASFPSCPSELMKLHGWESVCSGVLGIPLLEKVFWLLGFLVSCVSFLVSFLSFLGFLVSKSLGFLASTFQSFQDSIIPYYKFSISCSLIDIDLTSKNFKISLDGSSGFLAPIFFIFQNGAFPTF